jgi:hypothetical protein
MFFPNLIDAPFGLTRFVDRVPALGDDALKPKLLGDADQLVPASVKGL